MRIWLSTIGQRLDHADNTRTILLARFLLDAGHEVLLWTSAYDHIRKEWRSEYAAGKNDVWLMEGGLEVRFMKGCGYRFNVGVRRLVDHILAARDFRRQAAQLAPPDVVVASLPDHITAAAVVDYAKKVGAAAIIDVRDKWPDIFIDYAPALLKPLVRLGLLNESRRARRGLQQADALVAMMGSMLDWALAKAGREETADDRIFYLATTPKADADSAPMSDLSPANHAVMTSVADKTVFTFIGTYNRTQHPMLVLEAFAQLGKRKGFDADKVAVLIGGDGVDSDLVDRKIAELPFAHKLGWLKPPEMRAILVRSSVGMLPMNFASPAFNNKAFAYLACGIPIINGASGDLAELIDRENVGINVTAGDSASFADAAERLIADPALIDKMKQRTRALFAVSFDQDKIYSGYVAHIMAIAERRRSQS